MSMFRFLPILIKLGAIVSVLKSNVKLISLYGKSPSPHGGGSGRGVGLGVTKYEKKIVSIRIL